MLLGSTRQNPYCLRNWKSKVSDAASIFYGDFWIRLVAFLIDKTTATNAIAPLVSALISEMLVASYDLTKPEEMSQMLSNFSLRLTLDVLFMGTIFILFWVFKSTARDKVPFKNSIVDARNQGWYAKLVGAAVIKNPSRE